jgi:hypothetical protein
LPARAQHDVLRECGIAALDLQKLKLPFDKLEIIVTVMLSFGAEFIK